MAFIATLCATFLGAVLCVPMLLGVTLRPLLVWLLPDEICGPDGWYIDTRNRTGILDFGPRAGRV